MAAKLPDIADKLDRLADQHFSLVENLTDVGVIVEHPVNVKRIVFQVLATAYLS